MFIIRRVKKKTVSMLLVCVCCLASASLWFHVWNRVEAFQSGVQSWLTSLSVKTNVLHWWRHVWYAEQLNVWCLPNTKHTIMFRGVFDHFCPSVSSPAEEDQKLHHQTSVSLRADLGSREERKAGDEVMKKWVYWITLLFQCSISYCYNKTPYE